MNFIPHIYIYIYIKDIVDGDVSDNDCIQAAEEMLQLGNFWQLAILMQADTHTQRDAERCGKEEEKTLWLTAWLIACHAPCSRFLQLGPLIEPTSCLACHHVVEEPEKIAKTMHPEILKG